MHTICRDSDEQLLHEFASRKDHAAFERLVDRHARWVFAASMRQLREHHVAEDAVQIVFILLAQKAATMNRRQKLSGWLFNALQFTVKDLRRAAARRMRHEQAAARNSTAPDDPSVSELADILDPAVARLPDRYRAAILLRFYQGMAFDEIAGDLTISEPAARKRVERALEMLRHQLGRKIDASVLSAAALCGSEHASGALSAGVVKAALAAHTGAPLTGSTAATVKGVGLLMSAAKIQTAVIAGVVALLFVVPAGMYVASSGARHPTTPVIPAPPPPAPPAASEPVMVEDSYTLLPGQILRRIDSASLEARRNFLRPIARSAGLDLANPPVAIIAGFKNGEPQFWTWDFQKPYRLPGLIETLLGTTPQETEGDVAPFDVPGDFLYDQDATPEQRRAALEHVLQVEFHKPITLTYRDVQRKVVVLDGTWNYTRATPPRQLGGNIPTLELYEHQVNKMAYSTSVGDSRQFAAQLGKYIGQQVLIDAKQLPRDLVWCSNDPVDRQHDKPAVLNHLTEQTALTWSEQIRMVRRLFVEQKK